MKRTTAIHLGCLLSILTSIAGATEPVHYNQDIRPILQHHFAKCHGSKEQNGGINFEVRASVFAEADSGKRPVVAGNVDASELITRVNSTAETLRMPPEGSPLSEQQINALKKWISQGALWPESRIADTPDAESASHWSFQPIRDPQPPDVEDKSWRGALWIGSFRSSGNRPVCRWAKTRNRSC